MGGENRWLKTVLDFRDAKELTRDMAVSLLEKVEIYEGKRIHIRFRFRNEYEYFLNQLAERGKDCGREISS